LHFAEHAPAVAIETMGCKLNASDRIGPAMLIADSGDGLEGQVVENVTLS